MDGLGITSLEELTNILMVGRSIVVIYSYRGRILPVGLSNVCQVYTELRSVQNFILIWKAGIWEEIHFILFIYLFILAYSSRCA